MGTSSTDSPVRAGHPIGSLWCTRAGAVAFQRIVICATLACISGHASAHLGHGIASGERRLELELRERDVALGYGVGLATGSKKTELEAAHANGEEGSHLDALTSELIRDVQICVGESETSLECHPLEKRQLESVGASGWGTDTLTIDWRFVFPLRHRTLKLSDGWTRDDIARTDVAIRPLSTRVPLRAGPDSPKSVELEFAFDDRLLAGAPRIVLVELPPEPRSKWSTWISLGIVGALAVFVTILFLRRRRRAA